MREPPHAVPVAPARRPPGPAMLVLVLVLGVAVAALVGAPAAGQEAPPDGSTTTTTAAPTPTTIQLPDGDVGLLPPGATLPGATPPGPPPPEGEAPTEGQPPAEGEVPLPEELAVVVLPDPTPGLNAALAAIDVSASERLVLETGLPVFAARERTATARLDLRAAIDARRQAHAKAVAARRSVEALAVNALVYGDPAGLEPLGTPETLDQLRDLTVRDVVAEHLQHTWERSVAELRRALVAESSASRALADAERDEHHVEHAHVLARVELERSMARARDARNTLGPTILGPSVLDLVDLVTWYRTYYPADPPVAPIADIIDAYLRVGAEEGVTGDIAFAQAILETGGFRSGHAQGYNFAGIGAYDRCAPACGFRFARLDDGVRAHIQLLRAYADPDLTSEELAAPPNRLVAPEGVGVRGCCQRWAALTGVWASDTQYDRKVLGIYRLMVETARAIDRQAQQP